MSGGCCHRQAVLARMVLPHAVAMSFELKKGESISKGVRRIVCKRIDDALGTLTGAAASVSDDAVHDARKRLKEIRGALRLVRGEIGEKHFRRENRAFRDAGRPLSTLRDAKVLIDSLDQLIAHFAGRVKPQAIEKLRNALIRRRRTVRKQVVEHDRVIGEIVRALRSAKEREKNWPLQNEGWNAVDGGLRRIYAQGRRAMQATRSDPSDLALHEWRKRTKDLRYALELLGAIWPELIQPLAQQAHHLTNLLGDDHDLAVLREVAREELEDQSSVDSELLFALVDERRLALQKEAIELGRKLYKETDAKFAARLKGYWKTAKSNSR